MWIQLALLAVPDAHAQMCSCTVCPGAGVPSFGSSSRLARYTPEMNAVDTADLDGDGDLDLVSAAQDEGLAWYENLGGFAFTLHLVSVLPLQGGFYSVDTGDVDGDGDLDLLSQAFDRDEVIWHENLGGGAFGAVRVIASAVEPVEVMAADLDGDGFDDAVTSSYAGEFAWYRSNGDGTFEPAVVLFTSPAPIYDILLSMDWEVVSEPLATGDVDADGDVDLVASGIDETHVLYNQGDGTFCSALVAAPGGIDAVFLADGEGDGDPDLLLVAWPDGVQWVENDGAGVFLGRHWLYGGGSQYPADLDLDGDADFLDSRYGWQENVGGRVLTLGGGLQSHPSDGGNLAADLDGDGDPDLVSHDPYDGWIEVTRSAMDCRSPDTDGDGTSDAMEATYHGTDPYGADTDGDGLDDRLELLVFADPLDPDSDGDGATDGADPCPTLTSGDPDGDGVCANICFAYDCADVCPTTFDPDQADADRDRVGDACDPSTADVSDCDDGATWWPDVDLDGYGDPTGASTVSDTPLPGYADNDGDCDDADAAVNPGQAEIGCNGLDDDCDPATTDDEDPDGDGAGLCLGDCAPADPLRHPFATEGADGIDQDSDGVVDEGTAWYDDDGDGFTEVGGDCDDASALVSPAAVEVCDGLDQDCDGAIDRGTFCDDQDGDGWSEVAGDCHDGDPDVHPGAIEDPANGVDDDCDGDLADWVDDDGDGFTAGVDCDDDEEDVHDGAPETADGVDQDCDGLVDEGTELYDDDGDGFAEVDGDCHDGDMGVHPGAVERSDGVDEDCDGQVDEDTDFSDDDGDGRSEAAGDCDDTDPLVELDAPELANGVDDDCDGLVDEGLDDLDADGFVDDDCDDRDGFVHPGAPELCDDQDNDCDGDIDEGACDVGAGAKAGSVGCGCGGTGPVAPWTGLVIFALRRRYPAARPS